MKRMKRKVGRIQGITLTFMIYHYLLCCLQNPGQNVLPGWMGPRELVNSCFFLPLCFFALLLSAPLPCSLPGATKFPSPMGPRQKRGGCGREERSARRSRRAMGTSVPACCPPRPGIGFFTLPFSTSLYLLCPSARAVDRRRKWLWVLLLLGNGRAYFCAESCSQPRLKACAGLGWWWC